SPEDTAGEIGGLRTALLGPQGLPTEPHVVRTSVPFEISAVAMRAIQGNSGIRTAATVQHVLEQAAQAAPPQHGRRKRPEGRDRAATAGARAAAAGTARGAAPQDQDGPRTTASDRSDGPTPVRADDGPAGRIPPAGSGPVPPRR